MWVVASAVMSTELIPDALVVPRFEERLPSFCLMFPVAGVIAAAIRSGSTRNAGASSGTGTATASASTAAGT